YDAEIAKRLLKYDAGATYYRLNIGVTTPGTPAVTTFGIKRNSTYSIDITKINKLGTNDETKLDEIPETPVTSEETSVTATITIAQWNQMDQSGEL
ncbi:MAG: fimbria major subunit, partial [Mucinivorans sp.]